MDGAVLGKLWQALSALQPLGPVTSKLGFESFDVQGKSLTVPESLPCLLYALHAPKQPPRFTIDW
jgi:hypothetical protein